ncbi:MAG: histidine phosphatase family protein [Candidatus Nealsonbacteria bacterium]|nr:histidine phosphatase family protein [Candidatus Nealsonbacteria bacterium]
MNIYFVRHGQTKLNGMKMTQDRHEPLSDTGLKQARIVAQRVKTLPVEIIHASPMKRAAQTAGIIQEATGLEIVWCDLFEESHRPSVMIGKRNEDPFVAQVCEECNRHQNDINWHYSDEENFLEFKARAKKALEYLESLPQKNILVVSHGNFIKMLVLTMTLNDKVTPAIMYPFAKNFRLKNTALIHCQKNGQKWSIESFNDHRFFKT